jgi:hypothetical protein
MDYEVKLMALTLLVIAVGAVLFWRARRLAAEGTPNT